MFNRGQRNGQGLGFGRGFMRAGRGFDGAGQGGRGLGRHGGCGHGGRRMGAGRPSSGFCQRIQLRLTDEQKEFWMNNPGLQEEIRELIDKRVEESNSNQ